MSKKRIPKRAEENTVLTVSLSKDLKQKIQAAAAEDRRAVSPWVVIQLEKVLDDLEASRKPQYPDLKVADEPGNGSLPSTSAGGGVRYRKGRGRS